MIYVNTKKKKKIKIFIFIIILLLILLGLTQAFASDQNKNNNDIINNNIAPPSTVINGNNRIEENITNIDNNFSENVINTDNNKNIINIDNNIENNLNENVINIDDDETTKNNGQNNTINNDINNKIPEQIPEEPIKGADNKETRSFGSNVAFIGDSRTQAFLMYAGLKDVVDYTNVGLMVDTAITKKFITNKKGEKITILEDLKTKNVDTIYIMLGINELGWVYSSIFIEKYEELIDSIKKIKPNCEIIIQSIIPVTKTRSDSDNIYNNKKINEYNALIKEMADKKGIEYINLVPVLSDINGNLPEDASPDGIHLNKEYCLKWLECLKNN